MSVPATTLIPGDWAPRFRGLVADGPDFPIGNAAGRYVILMFLGSARHPATKRAVEHVLSRHRAWFDDRNACFFAITADQSDEREHRLRNELPGIRIIRDFDLTISRLYGRMPSDDTGDYRPATFVLDPMLRILSIVPLDPKGRHEGKLDQVIAELPPVEAHTGQPLVAPVLILPRIFEPELCRLLIAQYEAKGGRPSGFMRDIDGMAVEQFDDRHKRRSDLLITDKGLQVQIRSHLARRLVHGVELAFQFRATQVERYLVACYDAANGGFFSAHRDNTMKGTAHRRFAVTINLNAEDYDGGDLNFPEFGSRTYRAPTGGAVVFSCSLLHQALPVTRGRRYALLPFLYDDAGAEMRRQTAPFVASGSLDQGVNEPAPNR